MSNFMKTNGRSIMIGFTTLALTAFAGQAMAQDYSLKLTRSADVSVAAEYASIEKQINKYCRKMEKGIKTTLSRKMAELNNCEDVLLTDFLTQTGDPLLVAYHNGSKSAFTTSKFVNNDKDTKSN